MCVSPASPCLLPGVTELAVALVEAGLPLAGMVRAPLIRLTLENALGQVPVHGCSCFQQWNRLLLVRSNLAPRGWWARKSEVADKQPHSLLNPPACLLSRRPES